MLAGREVLALPDRHAGFAFLNHRARTLKGLRAVLCRDHADDSAVPNCQFTLAVDGYDTTYPRSIGNSLDNVAKRLGRVRVSAVVQLRHTVLATVMLTNDADKDRHRPRPGVTDHIERRVERKWLGLDRGVDRFSWCSHGDIMA